MRRGRGRGRHECGHEQPVLVAGMTFQSAPRPGLSGPLGARRCCGLRVGIRRAGGSPMWSGWCARWAGTGAPSSSRNRARALSLDAVDRVLHLIGFREANAGIAVTGRESSRGSGDEPVAGSHPADGCGPWVTVWNR